MNNIHHHNHPEVTPEELRLYGIDPDTIERNKVYTIDNTADTNQRRRLRKKRAEEEAARKKEEDRKKGVVNGAGSSEQGGASSSEQKVGFQPDTSARHLRSQATHHISTAPLRSAFHVPISSSGGSSSSEALESIAEYSISMEMAKLLRKELKREPSRHPRTTETPTSHWKFYVAQNDGAEEHLYFSMSIERRDEESLKSALEVFLNKKLDEGHIVLGFSSKIKILVDQELLRRWDNDQFFLVDTSQEEEWSLKYVDDRSN